MDKLETIDREAVEQILGPHASVIDRIHRRQRALFGVGGLATLTGATVGPALLAYSAGVGATTLLAGSVVMFLAGLAVVRAATNAQADRLRQSFLDHCEALGVDHIPIVRSARPVRYRWGFFVSLWDGRLPEDQ